MNHLGETALILQILTHGLYFFIGKLYHGVVSPFGALRASPVE
jgi:hypothetical protein